MHDDQRPPICLNIGSYWSWCKVTHCADPFQHAYVFTHTPLPKLMEVLFPVYCSHVCVFIVLLRNTSPILNIFYILHNCRQHVHKPPPLLPLLPHLFLLRLCRSSDRSVWRFWEPSRVIESFWHGSTKPTSSILGIRCPSATTVPRSWSTSLRPYQIQWRYEVETVGDVDCKGLWKSLCMGVNNSTMMN